MMRSSYPPRRRAFRPSCAALEARSLLSTLPGPIVPDLPNLPDYSYSTVPPSGDVNPYGIAYVPANFPGTNSLLHAGDLLVSNFNNSMNQQGTGTSIVDIHPDGTQSVFFTSTQPGLSTALGVLHTGFVIVGNVPADGSSVTGPGSIQVINRRGDVVLNLTDSQLLDGPWDLTVYDKGDTPQVYVSNVLNGTVSRIDLKVEGTKVAVAGMTQVASGYAFRTDPAALVVGPTGLAYDPFRDTLYVAATGDNAVFAVRNASKAADRSGTGTVIYRDPAHLRGPLGLALAPDGDLLTTNGDAVNPDPAQPSELIEFTTAGKFVGELSLDPAQGAAFGLALSRVGGVVTVATVNDDTNTVDFRTIRETMPARFGQHNLVSDIAGVADFTDPNLKDPWGVASGPKGPFWVSDQAGGVATLYTGTGQPFPPRPQPLVVAIPPGSNPALSGPTGQVFNGTGDFVLSDGKPALFLFATLDGTIAGWNPGLGTSAETVVPSSGGVYTGLALAQSGGKNYLYAADATGKIDVYDARFHRVSTGGAFPFLDPDVPAGLTPYNIQDLGGTLYVTYAQFGAGGGAVAAFRADGTLLGQVAANVAGGPLEAPWGLAVAPPTFGQFAGALLVGNLNTGRIDAYNLSNDTFLGQLVDPNKNQVSIPGLWALTFGNDGLAGSSKVLYFTAGINNLADGLFGSISVTT